MSTDPVSEVWAAIGRYEGVPKWWAETFVNIGLNAAEALTWVQTAERDSDSVLSRLREKELNVTLQGYARARGISLMGAGDGDDVVPLRIDHLVHKVSTVITAPEQEAVLKEVSLYADVEFREKVNGVYSQHAVANAVRSVHSGYINKVVGNCMVLEAGASVKSAVLAGVDTTRRHCCSPVLDVRDSVRHSLRGWLLGVARDDSKYRDEVRSAARAALDPDSGFVCRLKTQDCTRQVEMICSNESTHDVPFDDLPQIMARHGAKLWVGFMTRAPGVRSVGGPTRGISPVLGTKWELSDDRKKISFHFERDGSFSYTHDFAQWIKYEEQFGFRWRGQYFDYVYSRMPITTVSSLAFVVVRVPKTGVMLREPVYKASHLAGMVEVTSVRAIGGCLGGKMPKFEPVTFALEAIVFDRVLETRLALGSRGNLASTIGYMRSARVRMSINGVALGAISQVPVDLLEPAAVAVEVLAADSRRSGERDYDSIMKVAVSEVAFSNVLNYFSGLGSRFGSLSTKLGDAVRSALRSVLDGPNPIVVRAERCAPYVKVSGGGELGGVSFKPQFTVHGCGCSELTAINAALAMGSMLSRLERKDLEAYAAELRVLTAKCIRHDIHMVEEEEAEDAFYDAREDVVSVADTSSDVTSTVRSEGSTMPSSVDDDVSVVKADSESCGEVEVESEEPEGFNECESVCANGDVTIDSEVGQGVVVSAIKEYARWAQCSDRNARSEAKVNAEVLFLLGNPTLLDVERSTTARTRHAVVAVVGGRLGKIIGTLRSDEEFAEVYVRSLKRTCKVLKGRGGALYIKEAVTELCYTSSGLLVMNGDKLCRAAIGALQELPRGFSFPKYEFVDGVPGCGKTTEIISSTIELVRDGKSVMYLTATVASCEDVSKALCVALGPGKVVCKTYDSYAINGATPVGGGTVDVLFMDEAPMAHKGELFVAMLKASALDVKMYGDTKQIPWLPFMSAFVSTHAILGDEVYVTRRAMTHRFGAATCAMWLDVYGLIYPCDCCEHTDVLPRVESITSYAGVAPCPEGKVIVFTQEEKLTAKREGGYTASLKTLKSMKRGGLSTAAESQGGTHDEIAIVRLANKKNPKESRVSPSIYNRQPWVLVATTRHRGKLVYYTTAETDLVCARIALAKCAVRLEAVCTRNTWKSVESRAMHVQEFGV